MQPTYHQGKAYNHRALLIFNLLTKEIKTLLGFCMEEMLPLKF